MWLARYASWLSSRISSARSASKLARIGAGASSAGDACAAAAQEPPRRSRPRRARHSPRRRDDRSEPSPEQHAQRKVYGSEAFGLRGVVSDARGRDHESMSSKIGREAWREREEI